MAERTAVDGAAGGDRPAAAPLPAGRDPIHCLRCSANVSELPAVARFCNRCGFPLPEWFGAKPPSAPDSPPPLPQLFVAPLILLAYGRALFNLGWRYETAIGSRRNVEEAARCYWKAARLGDAAARERYGVSSLTAPALTDPPPLPPLPADFVEPPPPFAAVYRPGVS
jgi:TPR repeat protein